MTWAAWRYVSSLRNSACACPLSASATICGSRPTNRLLTARTSPTTNTTVNTPRRCLRLGFGRGLGGLSAVHKKLVLRDVPTSVRADRAWYEKTGLLAPLPGGSVCLVLLWVIVFLFLKNIIWGCPTTTVTELLVCLRLILIITSPTDERHWAEPARTT